MYAVSSRNDQLSHKWCQSCVVTWCLCMPLCTIMAVQLYDVPELTDSPGSRVVLEGASLIASLARFGDKIVVS